MWGEILKYTLDMCEELSKNKYFLKNKVSILPKSYKYMEFLIYIGNSAGERLLDGN